MGPLELVRLPELMARSEGRPEVRVALIDGHLLRDHPDLMGANVETIPGASSGSCAVDDSVACMHGTFVAGALVARRGSVAPAICPGVTLLLRPIFGESGIETRMPSATPAELAQAIVDCVSAGAWIINVSAALAQSSEKGECELGQALSYAAARDVIVVAAAGNQGLVGSTVVTRHPWVIPVAACDLQGKPTPESNLGRSIGRNGVMAPGRGVSSVGTNGKAQSFGGTSAAALFGTGTIALLWSEFLGASASTIKLAVRARKQSTRQGVVPPLLDAWGAYQFMTAAQAQR